MISTILLYLCGFITGIGLARIFCFVPSILLGAAWSLRRPSADQASLRKGLALLVVSTGTFVAGHALLRWQSTGVLRLLPLFVVAGAPFAALLFSRRWLQATALAILLVSASLYDVFMMGMTTRRIDLATYPTVLAKLSSLQPDHSVQVDCIWNTGPVEPLMTKEAHYTKREIYAELLRHMPTPTIIGLVGGPNTEIVYPFGPYYQNRIVPLVDCRQPDHVLAPPEGCRFVVVDDYGNPRTASNAWAAAHGFRLVFQATHDQTRLLAAYERTR